MSEVRSRRRRKRAPDALPSREELIEQYAPMIKFIAQRLAARLPGHISYEELINSGVISLIDAIDKFDPSRGIQFKTYAEFRVKGEMLDELRAMDWATRSLRQRVNKLDKAYMDLERRLGRYPTLEEVAEELNVDLPKLEAMLEKAASVSLVSLEEFGPEGSAEEKSSTLNYLTHPAETSPLAHIELGELKDALAHTIEELSAQEKLVVMLYYHEELTMKEVGEVLGLTESRVSQIHSQAVTRLRIKLRKLGFTTMVG